MASTPFPTRVPIVNVYRGDTTTWPTYTFRDDAGALINLAGYAWLATWRPTPDSATVTALAVDTSAAASGVLGVSATSAQTQAMTVAGTWDLQSTVGGVVRTWIYGAVSVTSDVTHA